MAVRIEDMLRPGERVVWREPRSWLPRHWRWRLIDLGVVVALFAGLWLWGLQWEDLDLSISVVAAVLVGRCFHDLVWRGIKPAVTDQRAFVIDPTGERLGSTSVELAEARAVEVGDQRVWVTKADGRAAILGPTAYAAEFGRALAAEAGLPPPREQPSKEKIATLTVCTLALTAFFGCFALAIGWAAKAGLLSDFPLCLLAILPAVPLSFFAVFLGELAGVIALRPFFGKAEAERWLDGYGKMLFHPPHQNDPLVFAERRMKLLTGVSSLLYGRSFAAPRIAELRHG
jgi:hypothetical protein